MEIDRVETDDPFVYRPLGLLPCTAARSQTARKESSPNA